MTVDERFSDDYLAKRQDTALLGKRNPIVTGPVSDWATDFSHLEPEWAALLARVVHALAADSTTAQTSSETGSTTCPT